MKKLGIYFMMLAVMAVVFVGCKTEDPNDPSIAMPSAVTYDLDKPGDFEMIVAITATDEDLTSVYVYLLWDNDKYEVVPKTDLDKNQTSWTKTFKADDFDAITFEKDKSAKLWVEVTTKGTNASGSTTINDIDSGIEEPPVETPLDAEKDFKWERIAPAKGTGLAEFGLEWKSNTGTKIVIEPLAGTRLVELKVSDWATIETKEDLKAAVDAGTPLTKWEEIPVKIDLYCVIATKTADGEYFMIKPEKREVDPNDGGHRTVTGKYKK